MIFLLLSLLWSFPLLLQIGCLVYFSILVDDDHIFLSLHLLVKWVKHYLVGHLFTFALVVHIFTNKHEIVAIHELVIGNV